MTSEQQASLHVLATPRQIRDVLLQPLALPDWNEAFLSITGPPDAAVGVRYPITVRTGLRGHFAYRTIEPARIDAEWQVPGFHETGTWALRAQGSGTVVSHGFEHTGPLAALLAPAYRGVAELRLNRLATRLAERTTTSV